MKNGLYEKFEYKSKDSYKTSKPSSSKTYMRKPILKH